MKKRSKNPKSSWFKDKFIKPLLERKMQLDVLCIILLVGLTFYAWRLLPDIVIRSDGFLYLLNDIQRFWGWSYSITGFETAAVAFGGLFAKLFGPYVHLYLWVELVWVLLISVLFFIFVKVLTKRSIVAFSGALIASSSYFGNWDMLGTHCYCFFVERVTVVPLLITSLIFLHLYLERSKGKYYLISIGFYFLGVGLAHFSVLFTAPYLLYPFLFRFFNHKKKKEIVWGGLIGISYLLLSTFFVGIQQINESGLRPTWGFLEFLINPQKFGYIENMIHQLVHWSQYPPILQNLDDPFPFHHLTVKNTSSSAPWVLIAYAISAVFIYFKLPKQRAILATSIAGIITILYLNAYFHLHDVIQPDAHRYLYFPTFLFAIFWSHFLWAAFFKSGSKKLALLGVLLLMGYYSINTMLIGSKIYVIRNEWERATIAIFNKFYKINDSLPNGSVVIGPWPAIGPQEADFFTEKLGKGKVIYTTDYRQNWPELASKSAHAIFVRYDKTCDCVKEERIK